VEADVNDPQNLGTLPETIPGAQALEELLSRPTPAAVRAMGQVEGDLLVLGVAGKMGPTLARMARRASDAAGVRRRIVGVSRFSQPESRAALEAHQLETIQGDLLDRPFADSLPDVPNVIFMAGMKFGTQGNEARTWAMNVYLPAMVCEKFHRSRIVAFSTGNVYGLVPVDSAGSVETDPLRPCGEYAMSCLGRERIFEHFSRTCGTPTALLRLNYAVEMRYGVLVDLAERVYDGQVVDLSMGYVNVIWQGEANALALCALPDARSPPLYLNVAGPERLSVRAVCEQFGRIFDKPVRFRGEESPDALLSNGQEAYRRYGPPQVGVHQIIRWIAQWIREGGSRLGKRTHFESRNGAF
jgi:nucleoside-diphosphate-sugar epimerase